MHEVLLKVGIGIGGAAVSFLYGGWSTLLSVLLAFVIIDYISGVTASYFEGKLSSKVGLRGIAKKVGIFAVVAMAHLVDVALGGQSTLFRDAAIFFYLANELLSFTENAGRIGLPVPAKLSNAIEALKEKGDK